jgi:hypothetical protein
MDMRRLGRSGLVMIVLLALLACGIVPAARADEIAPSQLDEIPLLGRPVDLPFSDASGWFTVTAHAEPTVLRAEAPLTLTVMVRAAGRVRRPPKRVDLAQVPAFAADFHIVRAEDSAAPLDGAAGPDTWEFAYRLKPRRAGVAEVPSFPFGFFNPDIRPASRGFQVIYTDPIPLRVGAAELAPVAVRAPASAYAVATGPAVLARQSPWQAPGAVTLVTLLAAPPLLGVVWYLAWRRDHPAGARQLRRRRSRAAREALEALRGVERRPPRAQAEHVERAVAGYLRQRLDLPPEEPTATEVALFFVRHGYPLDLAAQAEKFFLACDAARFRPPAPGAPPTDLTAAAARLVLAVEELP